MTAEQILRQRISEQEAKLLSQGIALEVLYKNTLRSMTLKGLLKEGLPELLQLDVLPQFMLKSTVRMVGVKIIKMALQNIWPDKH